MQFLWVQSTQNRWKAIPASGLGAGSLPIQRGDAGGFLIDRPRGDEVESTVTASASHGKAGS